MPLPRHAPVHPGEVLAADFLAPLDLTQYRLAHSMSVPPRRINEIVLGKRAISADTALRLARFFGTSERFWLNLQARYDLELERDRLGGRLLHEVTPWRALKRRRRETQKGSALLLVLVVVVVVTLSGALAHRRALDTLREGRTALAVLRASEAARSGLTRAVTGGPLAGSLPGGTSWVVTVNTTSSGDRILRSVGTSSAPYPATSEALTMVDSTGTPVMSSVTVRR